MQDQPNVLIVEDEPHLANLYADWLGDICYTTIAYNGSAALKSIDASIDIVLLDRRMPGLSGDSVLDTIRERDLDCQVAMVTAVEPDFDIIEMGFDDYLVKPITRDELIDVIDQLLLRSTYGSQLQEFYILAAKKALLDAEKSEHELQTSNRYARLEERLESLKTQVDGTMRELVDRGAYQRVCYDMDRKPLP